MNELYQGVLPVKHLAAGTEELSQIKQELAKAGFKLVANQQ